MDTYPSHLEGEVKFATQNAKLSRIRQGNIYLLDAQPNWPAEGRKSNRANQELVQCPGKGGSPGKSHKVGGPFGATCTLWWSGDLYEMSSSPQPSQKGCGKWKEGRLVSHKDLWAITVRLVGVLLHTNHQRPSTICNTKIDEYNRSKMVMEGRTTIHVARHKTGTTGTALRRHVTFLSWHMVTT